MRVTSKMMTSNSLNNINRNKANLSVLANQYATQQKIQRPSEDPVIAVRSLKYRTSISELTQFAKKNVPDAMSWISNTESALTSVNDILTKMNTYFTQGANDTLETTERDALVQTLTEYKDQIFQCLNSDYAGRYLFTGYRTDTSLTFPEAATNLKYTITEPIKASDIQIFSYVKGELTDTGATDPSVYTGDAVSLDKSYRFSLSYNGVDNVQSIKDGNTELLTVGTISSSDPNRYDLDAYNNANGTSFEALVIKETGEVITNKAGYDKLKAAKDLSVQYDKTGFEKGDVRPEHYFTCQSEKYATDGSVVESKSFEAPAKQHIEYEVNFSQNITVNTLANECLNASIINQIDDIINQIEKVQNVEKKLSDIELKIKNGTHAPEEKDALVELKAQVENELALHKSVLQEKFGNGITTTSTAQASVNKAVADLGSRYKRLELTESRLQDQLTTFNEMLTSNDTVDIEEAVVNYTAALTAYNASLNATAKIAENSLLDFL
ncbi:MAG: flagellar hook-associated protein FlgL [Clostridium sp.]|nr:flagellar hook-associated protein FlgL [Clostridium sp.]